MPMEHIGNCSSSGTGYKTGDTIVIPGTALGGSTNANDLTLTITANQSLGYNLCFIFSRYN